MSYRRRTINRSIIFPGFPDFQPNVSPRQIFEKGSFGGTYWRPIYSSITTKKYSNEHHKYDFLKGIPDAKMTKDYEKDYDVNVNTYKVKVGMTLNEWEERRWITKEDPYGWVQWYCEFYSGRRIPEIDELQIKRWQAVAGNKNGRWKRRLVNMIKKKKGKYDDFNISPKIRQTLQHWGYQLVENDLKIDS